jgi:hypothetical protein
MATVWRLVRVRRSDRVGRISWWVATRGGPWRGLTVDVSGRCAQQLPGCVRVADCGGLATAEDLGQVQRVGAAGEGFVEVAVDAQPFQGCRQSAQDAAESGLTDRVEPHGGCLADQQVGLAVLGQRLRRC